MEYTALELLTYLFFYSFLGWVIEVILLLAGGKPFSNRGFFNLPICPEYGVMADLLLIILPTAENGLTFFVVALTVVLTIGVVSCVDFISAYLANTIWHRKLKKKADHNILGGKWQGSKVSLIQSACVLAVIKTIHPFLYATVGFLPKFILRILLFILLLLLALDFFATLLAIYRCSGVKELERLEWEKSTEKSVAQSRFISRLAVFVWKRMKKAYPDMEEPGAIQKGKDIFAQGICPDKLIWIFIIWAFAGDLMETLYCRMVAGYWMSRTSVIYGTFSIVWGFGAVLITLLMQYLRHREDRYIFFAGMLLGGTYEYSCSVISEYFFGTTFWDYSDMTFNIGGRTNLLFCVFWGVIAVFWVKICYPTLSRWIEKIHPIYGKILTWAIVVLMVADLALSGVVLIRNVERRQGHQVENLLDNFIDLTYSDEFIEGIWPNMRIQ